MSYRLVLTASFKRSVRRLKKRFKHVKSDVSVAVRVLLETPKLGVVIPGESGARKLRVRNSDLARGKSIALRMGQRPLSTCYYYTPSLIAKMSPAES